MKPLYYYAVHTIVLLLSITAGYSNKDVFVGTTCFLGFEAVLWYARAQYRLKILDDIIDDLENTDD